MASPVDAARAASSTATANTAHTINVNSPAAGDLLVVVVRYNGDPSTVTFTGYTQLLTDGADASDDITKIFYRWADGTEGVSDAMTTVTSTKLSAVCWRITGAHPSIVPDVSTVAVGTTVNTCNPTSVSGTGGSKDYLFLAIGTMDGEVGTFTVAPTNYTNLQVANSGTGGTALTNTICGGATRQLTAASDDPGAFTHAVPASGWSAWVLAIHPSSQLPFVHAPVFGRWM